MSAGGEVVIQLRGYDLDGDDLMATISSVPESGTLHQASRRSHHYDAALEQWEAAYDIDGLATIFFVHGCFDVDSTRCTFLRPKHNEPRWYAHVVSIVHHTYQ